MLDEELLLTKLYQKKSVILNRSSKFEKARKVLGFLYEKLSKNNLDELVGALEKLYNQRNGRILVSGRPFEVSGYGQPLEPLGDFKRCFKVVEVEKLGSWATNILSKWCLIGVDGGQIYPSFDFNLPLRYVQAAAFIKKPSGNFKYKYKANFLTESKMDSMTREVDLERMNLEFEMVREVIDELSGEKRICVLMDMPLSSRYLRNLVGKMRRKMIKPVKNLLKLCREKEIYVFGYTSISYAWDVVASLILLGGGEIEARPYDIGLFLPYLNKFGLRTPVFRLRSRFIDKVFREEGIDIAFTYLKTSSGPPARLEFPEWMLRKRVFGEVLKAVLAEVYLGEGYPYALLRAHESASLTIEDREKFYVICKSFLEKECGIALKESVKRTRKVFSIL